MKNEILRFRLEGMTCSSCSARIERVINTFEEVEIASVSLAASMLTAEITTKISKEIADGVSGLDAISARIIERVEQVGFKAFPLSFQDDSKKIWKQEQDRLALEMNDKKNRLTIESIFSLPIMIIAMGAHVGMPLPSIISMHDNPLNFALIQLVLLLPVLWLGRDFYVRGIPNFLRGAPNMDSLVAIGTGAAFLYSLWSTYEIFAAQNAQELHSALMGIYYESCAILITLISFGKYLELRSKNKTQDAIKSLMDLSPKTVSLVVGDGSYIEIETEDIRIDDRILIKSGKQIPIDGIIIDGSSSLDMSAITGEFMPVSVKVGDSVTSGSLNVGGVFTMKAERVGSDTVLAKIISLVQEAQGSKAPIARLADLVSLYFVPTVMMFALISGLAWYYIGNIPFGEALKIFVAVMVVACPCALGLATPMSVMVATGRAAKLGLLIKNGTALELAGKINTIVFDKTGTLTEGKPHLNIEYMLSTIATADRKNSFIMQLARSMETKSDHPLAKAFFVEVSVPNTPSSSAEPDFSESASTSAPTFSTEPSIESATPSVFYEFEEVEEISGRGLRAVLPVEQESGKGILRVPYCIGNRAFMEENNIELTEEEKACMDKIMNEGKSPLIFGQALHRSGEGKPFASEELPISEERLTSDDLSAQARKYSLPSFDDRAKVLAIFSVEDRIREESKDIIAELKQMGIRPLLLSGDNRQSVYAVGAKVGIAKEDCIAEVMPADKEAQITALQKENQLVAMVGDGINDAPALAKADVGMVMGSGMDIAMEAGDLVLLRGITGISSALRLSRATVNNIKLSLFWAFAYNVLLLPVAAGLFLLFGGPTLSPMLAGAAMAFSSVSVVTNALRLRNFS